MTEFKPRSMSVQSMIRPPTIPQEFQDTVRDRKKSFIGAMLGLKDSRESDDNRSTRSKQASVDGIEHDSEPLALSQRRRVLTLMNYGLYSFDESVLTWLRMEGEERHSWFDAIRFTLHLHTNRKRDVLCSFIQVWCVHAFLQIKFLRQYLFKFIFTFFT
ncbi:unnamed protein product [Nippostrongylus brasiliensis]|uniref:Uncharacterized protein n=1 Tax=Nippostrongylus brasiliensis TaxID=27835 RepID=A0A0N4XML4_NIPBR|nr:unnamed protein product [Nippostrongylus brasiliensis]